MLSATASIVSAICLESPPQTLVLCVASMIFSHKGQVHGDTQ
jgi:hypothetical protein